uniref:Carboxylesterase type B domain-containing protein n=1 Tax=Acrobeloides nanus TaxID=290746 RepID=A0A914CR64_9BILA
MKVFENRMRSSEPNGYPVLVFIHGGGFGFGSTSKYGYEHLSQNFVSHDIVVVTLQYRLGPFGFFSTGDYILPGNTGLWDQMYALHFLHQVLPYFGADPNRITVWGHSAGAASLSGLAISPHSS